MTIRNDKASGVFHGRTALITGATGSIGLAIAEQLAKDGLDLILLSRSADKLEAAVKTIDAQKYGITVQSFVCDVRHAATVSALLERLASAGTTLYVVVNCAGISGGGLTAQVSDELWNDVIDTNLNGTFYVTRDALRLGLIPKGGRIINIASTGGKQGVIHGAPYSASKHGMVGFTRSLALELARDGSQVTVNAVCPGFVESEMAERVRSHYASIWHTDAAETRRRVEDRIPIGRYVEPAEVAALTGYLVSPAADAITGQALNVCGGLGTY
jgi:ketoreductase